MPLSAPAERELVNSRDFQMRGYRRSDGLWDIEGHLVDRRSYEYKNKWTSLQPGEVLHEMWLRLTVDDTFTIQAVEAAMDATPFPSCPNATASFQSLVGLRIRPGWLKTARERVGGTAGCTHLVQMLAPMATMVFQTIGPFQRDPQAQARKLERMIDTCYGWRSDGEAVQERRAQLEQGG